MTRKIFRSLPLLLLCNYTWSQNGLEIKKLTDSFYIYTTYKAFTGKIFPSNSMYYVDNTGILLFDTPWDTLQLKPLIRKLEDLHGKKIIFCLSTHFHDDRTAGLSYLNQNGIPTYSSKMTRELCLMNGNETALHTFENDTIFKIDSLTFEIFYPGAGHSPDNVVIWFPEKQLLYGGCFVKSTENNDLGNLEDADVTAWKNSVIRVMRRYKKPKYVIPGHFGWNDPHALQHTLNLIKKYLKKQKK